MTRTLVLMRHAKAQGSESAATDHDRPLAPRGRAAAPAMANWFKCNDLVPGDVISSTAARALETATLVCEAIELDPPRTCADLYMPGIDDMLAEIAQARADRVLLVSHNPTCEMFLQQITGECRVMPTAAAAVIQFDVAQWSEVLVTRTGKLVEFQQPRALS